MESGTVDTRPWIDMRLETETNIIPYEAPWTTSVTFVLTLHCSSTPITFPRQVFTVALGSQSQDQKWMIEAVADEQKVEWPDLFFEYLDSSGMVSNDISLALEKPFRLILSPFHSLKSKGPEIGSTFRQDRSYRFKYKTAYLSSYFCATKLGTKLQRDRGLTSSMDQIPIDIHASGDWTFLLTSSTPSPWIEVLSKPTTLQLDLHDSQGTQVDLTLTLRSSSTPIVIPLLSGSRTSQLSLSQLGGRLAYINRRTKQPIPLQPPRIFVNQAPKPEDHKQLYRLCDRCFTLHPDMPVPIQQVLFMEAKTECSVAAQQFGNG